jgi:hypothetical protein
LSGKTIVDQYSAYSGCDPESGNNDNGSNVRDVLSWRQNQGLLDDTGYAPKIGAYVPLEPGNLDQLREALWLSEAVGIGIQSPQSAMDQLNAGHVWSVVPGTQIERGQYVPLVGHPIPGIWTCVTRGPGADHDRAIPEQVSRRGLGVDRPRALPAGHGPDPAGLT